MNEITTVNFYKTGFFGYSDEVDFHMGSIWHILPIVVMIIVIFLIYKFRKQIKNFKYESVIRYALAIVMLFVEMSFFWRLLYVGNQGSSYDMMSYLPIQMCQWGLLVCVFTVISKNNKLFNFNFYITLIFATVALAYPLVITNAGPRYYRYYQFWLEHILPIISVFYLMFVHGLKPSYKGIYGTMLAISPLIIISIIVNSKIPDANYLYLKLDIPFLPEGQIIRAVIVYLASLPVTHLMCFVHHKLTKTKKVEEQI